MKCYSKYRKGKLKNLILITDHFQGLIVELREKLASHEDDKDVDFSVDI